MLKTYKKQKASWVLISILFLVQFFIVALIFVTDLYFQKVASISILYSLVVFYSWIFKNRLATMFSTLICTILIVVATVYTFDTVNETDFGAVARLINIFPLWLISGLIMFGSQAMDRLEMSQINQRLKVRNKTIQFKKREKEFHEMLDSMVKSSVMRLSKKGIVETWPKSAQLATGFTADEVVGKSYEIFFPKGDRELQLPQKFLAHALFNNKSMAEGWILKKDNGRFWAAASLFAMKDQLGYVSGFTLVVHDLSYRLKNEELKRQNAVLESRRKEMGQFVFVASHDLKEPLRNLKSLALTLDRKLKSESKDPVIGQMIAYLKTESDRAEDLITGLTEYANPGWNKSIDEVDIQEIISEVLLEVKNKFNKIKVSVKGIDELPVVMGPAIEIKTLFNQLITNAFKFGVQNKELEIDFKSKMLGDKWVFSIADKGPGIVEEARAKVFAPFAIANKSRKDRFGRGLGLAISKKIVENMFGEIWLDNDYEHGCRIVFTIPKNLESIYVFNEDNAGG